jgi:CII-binding regulator of phage lambda lysogenization HflD
MAENEEKDKSLNSEFSRENSIEQIREILFGTHARSLESKLNRLTVTVGEMEKQFSAASDRIQKDEQRLEQHQEDLERLTHDQELLHRLVDEIHQKLRGKIDELIDRKVDKQHLGQALRLVGDRIEQNGTE